jgi:hypothetical protein
LFAGEALAQSCTTTLSSGNSISTAIGSSSAGDTICLGDGNYSGFTLNAVTRSPRVTVRAVNPGEATITGGLTFSGGTYGFTFDGVNFSGVDFTGANTREITLSNADASAGTIQIDGVTHSSPNILFDNLTHYDQDNTGFCHGGTVNCVGVGAYHFSYDGRSTPVATIRGAIIDRGCADGIQSGVPFILEYSQIKNKVVGSCINDPHTDATQLYGGPFEGTIIRKNYYYSNVQVLAAYDGVDGVLIEDNVFDPGPSGERRECQIELYSDDTSTIRWNTVVARTSTYGHICLDAKAADDDGFGTIIENNIANSVSALSGSTYATKNNNLLVSGASGTDISGSPTYVGGTNPTTWAGFQLDAASLGYGDATDSSNIGTRYYGTTIVRPEPPTNVVVTDNSDHLGWFAVNW